MDGEVRRASGGSERREVGGLADAPKEPVDGLLILNQGDEAHAAPAALACGKIIAECATEKLEEGAIATPVRGLAAVRLGGRRR